MLPSLIWTGKSGQTVTTYLNSVVMQSRWENVNHLQSEAADLHQSHHLMMKRKRQPTAISRERFTRNLKVQSPNRQCTTYNYTEWLDLMLLNSLPTQELLRTQSINGTMVHLLYIQFLLGKKKFGWKISMKFATFEERLGMRMSIHKAKDLTPN